MDSLLECGEDENVGNGFGKCPLELPQGNMYELNEQTLLSSITKR